MKHVLVVCNHNAGRSQMAQAFFNRDAPEDVRAESAGSNPARHVWPVVEVMREVGIELSDQRPRKLLHEMQLQADWAVTMGCDDACGVEAHVRELIETKLDAIRSYRTAHQLRLAQTFPELAVALRQTRECLRKETCDVLATT